MHDNEQLKLEEYRSLQEEHRKNRGYIFGSPVLVLGIVAAGIEYSTKTGLENPLISAILIFIICYSIWFLGNRLQSDARIVSYIHLVHEGEYQSNWMGWWGKKGDRPEKSPNHDDSERESWLRLSGQGLKGAYGNDEPEYQSDLLKEVNPSYEAR